MMPGVRNSGFRLCDQKLADYNCKVLQLLANIKLVSVSAPFFFWKRLFLDCRYLYLGLVGSLGRVRVG